MGALVDRAGELAAQLADAVPDLYITHDPAKVLGNTPCVLITPPRIDHTDRLATWSLWALTDQPGTLAGWTALDDLHDQIAAVLPIEQTEPAQLQLGDVPPLSGLRMTYQETSP